MWSSTASAWLIEVKDYRCMRAPRRWIWRDECGDQGARHAGTVVASMKSPMTRMNAFASKMVRAQTMPWVVPS